MLYVLPPLLGAVIGYVTNALAIKMLFRPLRAYKLLGIPVPFTPGIIPRQRDSLARNIGTMVSTQLVAPETVIKRLEDPETFQSISLHLESSLKSYFQKPLRELLGKSSSSGQGNEPAFLDRPELLSAADRLLELAMEPLTVRSPAELLGMDAQERSYPWDQPGGKEAFLRYLDGRIRKMAGGKDWLDPGQKSGVLSGLTNLLEGLYPAVVNGMLGWLESPEVKNSMEAAGLVLLERTLSRLSGFQRFFVSAGQYDRTLADNMGAMVSDMLGQLRLFLETPAGKQKILAEVAGALEKFLTPESSLMGNQGSSPLTERISSLADKAWDLLQPLFSRWAGEAMSRPVEEWIQTVTGGNSSELRQHLLDGLKDFLSKRSAGMEASPLETFFKLRPADILPLEDQDFRKASEFLTRSLTAWSREAVPGLLQSFNVQKVVEDRINSLDILEVENLLLLVIRKHLVYINWIGAVLGGMIGALQLIL